MTTGPVSCEVSLPDDDLGFEAFRYAAGEMTDDEAAAFEGRLAADQQAREALARSVEVAQAVAVLGRQVIPAAVGRRRTARPFAVVSLVAALAACVALAVAIDPFGGRKADRPGDDLVVQAERPATAARLVGLWADSEDLLDGDAEHSSGSGFSFWSEDIAAGESGADSEFAWLLAAVSAEFPTLESLPPDHEQEN